MEGDSFHLVQKTMHKHGGIITGSDLSEAGQLGRTNGSAFTSLRLHKLRLDREASHKMAIFP